MVGKIIFKIIVPVLLVPVCWALSVSLYEALSSVGGLSDAAKAFSLGAVLYMLAHIIFTIPTKPYVFGHELMHAMATWASGGKVKAFKVSSKGGAVATDKSNIFISLAPYIVPIYTIAAVLLFFIFSLFWDVSAFKGTFVLLVGFTFAFHIVSTIEALKVKQSDLVKSGYLLSIVLIYLFNISIAALAVSFLFAEFPLRDLFEGAYFRSLDIYEGIFRQLFMRG